MRFSLTPRRLRRAASFVLLIAAAPLIAQSSVADDCFNARQAERKKHADALDEIHKREIDVDAEYRKAITKCSGDNDCRVAAAKQREQSMIPLRTARIDENARDAKAYVDINRDHCVSNPTRTTRQSGTPANDTAGSIKEEILGDGDRTRLFKLSATMEQVAQELDDNTGNPALEFAKGLGDWASGTLQFLAQKPGVPLQQMSKAIATYLTNDNAKNHKALRAAAQQAVREFQKNPARFIGQNLPNVLPGPGALGKAPALRQIAQVEKAAERLEKLAATEAQFGKAYGKALEDGAAAGANVPAKCYSVNACFDVSVAEAQLFKTGGPTGTGQPWRIRGVKPWTADDLRHTADQIRERLKPYGDHFAPTYSDTYTPAQLDAIANGNPILTNGPDQIRQMLNHEGAGRQGLVFVEFERLPTHTPDDVLGHVLNVQNDKGLVQFVDKTMHGMDPTFYFPQVTRFWFFPMP